MNDAECFDKLVQMRGELRWNPIMRKWICYGGDHLERTDAMPWTVHESANEAVSREHAAWIKRQAADQALLESHVEDPGTFDWAAAGRAYARNVGVR